MLGLVRTALLAACVALAGCVVDDHYSEFFTPTPVTATVSGPDETLAPAPVPSSMPWQLTPASTASIAQGEKTVIVADLRYGKVKGTPTAVANLDKPVIAFTKQGRIVSACKALIERQAKKIGAYSVQAAAAGPELRTGTNSSQQVFFRVIYDGPKYLEVRQSALFCTTDASNRVLGAHPV